MEDNRSCLLATARPYLQIFSVLALTPPPMFFESTSNLRLRRNLKIGYCCFACGVLLLVTYECYVNILSLQQKLEHFHVEDFSKVMGTTHKGLILVMAICNHLNMLFNYRRLGGIYKEIAKLEADIDVASEDFGGQRRCCSFRFRLAICVGLWMVLLVPLVPSFSYDRLSLFQSETNKIITEIVLIMLQLKGPEYCVFVMFVYELILRVRHTLQQINQELEDCDCRDRLQELCVALKRNQLFVGRIWRLVGELGSYFTLSMMLLFIYNGFTILHMVNWAIIKTGHDCCPYKRVAVSVTLTLNLLLVCSYSECCTNEYKGIPRILRKIRNLSIAEEFPTLKMGLREYLLQMQHLKLLFTCSGFFDISLKYFAGMLVTILGYIIILVQFKVQAFVETQKKEDILNN
ncbi:putative gustatory receptor 98d [Drosophila serrata]|uniref:putative gustatory receptor 98d n=1 Tax=Drosophila serrata TaxID=7274 RepID=UPI000A1D31C2|nr:putative gustatory receptor 98d [Drosophila serrata]